LEIEKMSIYKKVKVALLSGKVVDCYDIKPRVFNTWLADDLGIAKTRLKSLGEAVDQLHDAMCYVDWGRDDLTTMTVGELLNEFGSREDLYKHFKEIA
tara:strand:+ start:245 stop:538 length:294 start_codon:yes stop_codon:yes gene_type:complete